MKRVTIVLNTHSSSGNMMKALAENPRTMQTILGDRHISGSDKGKNRE